MRISSDTYRQAAERLNEIAAVPILYRDEPLDAQHQWVGLMASLWAAELRGAAEALAHHEDAIDQRSGGIHENDHGPCTLIADDLMQATGAIWGYLDAIDSPAPHIRDRALDDLRGCAATLRCLPA